MKIFYNLLLALALMCGTSSCVMCNNSATLGQEATINLENADVQALNKVQVAHGGIVLHLSQGPSMDIRVENPHGLGITIDANGDVLDIKGVRKNVGDFQADVYVTLPNINDITVTGSSDITTGNITSEQMTITIMGSGDVTTGSLQATSLLTLTVAGSGDIDIASASAEQVKTFIKGSGDIDINTVNATHLTTSVHGSGDVEIDNGTVTNAVLEIKSSGDIDARLNASGTVDASIQSTGNIALTGNIAHLNKAIKGSGEFTYSPTNK